MGLKEPGKRKKKKKKKKKKKSKPWAVYDMKK